MVQPVRYVENGSFAHFQFDRLRILPWFSARGFLESVGIAIDNAPAAWAGYSEPQR
jgi:hypothetical protein